MKTKLLLIMLIVLLAACTSDDSILSFSEFETVPDNLNQLINPHEPLQLIYEGEQTAYVIYQSAGDPITDIEEQDDTLKILISEADGSSIPAKQHVYKLTLDDHHEVIDVFINGKSTAFDRVSTLGEEN